MAGEPGAHLGVLVGGVVVDHGVNHLGGRHGGLDLIEEADELLHGLCPPTLRHARRDHRAHAVGMFAPAACDRVGEHFAVLLENIDAAIVGAGYVA